MTRLIEGIEDAPTGTVTYLVAQDTRSGSLEVLDVSRITSLQESIERVARAMEKRREIRDILLDSAPIIEESAPTFDYVELYGRPVEVTYRNAGLGVLLIRIEKTNGENTTGLIRLETNAEQDVTLHNSAYAISESAPTYIESFVYWDER